MAFQKVCDIQDIVPGTGVCALIDGQQVAVFRPSAAEEVRAISNMDPFYQSNVLSRGLIVEHQGELWVASRSRSSALTCQQVHAWKMSALA